MVPWSTSLIYCVSSTFLSISCKFLPYLFFLSCLISLLFSILARFTSLSSSTTYSLRPISSEEFTHSSATVHHHSGNIHFAAVLKVTRTSGKFMLPCNKWMRKLWMVQKEQHGMEEWWVLAREKEDQDKREGGMRRRYLGHIWWCHGKQREEAERVFRNYLCFGILTVRHRSRRNTDMFFFQWKHVARDKNTPLGPLPNAAYPRSGVFRPAHVAWHRATVLQHFIIAICVPSDSTSHVPLTRWKLETVGNPWQAPWPVVLGRDQ